MRSITQRNGACPAVAAFNLCKPDEHFEARVPTMPITSLQPVFGSAKSGITKAVAFLLLFVSAFLLGGQGQAFAAWPIAASEQVSLGFMDRYASSSEEAFTHRGVDIPAKVGAQVRAPVAGEISFVGSIPADESNDSPTTLGVSIRIGDGRVVTLLPFNDVCVSEGDAIGEGDMLGTLATSGDRSSPTTHLHMGLKRGRTYYDPMEILGGLELNERPEPEVAPVAVVPIALPAEAHAAPALAMEASLAVEAPAKDPSSQAPIEASSISSPIEADALKNYRESLEGADDEADIASSMLCKISAILDGFLHNASTLFASIGGTMLAILLAAAGALTIAARMLVIRARKRVYGKSSPSERRLPARQRRDLQLRAAHLLGQKRPLAN